LSKFAELLPALYAHEERSGWSRGMRALTHALLARRPPAPGPMLEVGCGGGAFLTELANYYPDRTQVGIDLNSVALGVARTKFAGGPTLGQADLQQLPFAAATFGAVVALDSFDQQGVDTKTGLAETWRVLRPRGLLLLRVSAHHWLEGAHDVAFNTGRRFARTEIVRLLHGVGFATVQTTYANTLLSPAIVAVRLLQRWGVLSLNESLYTAPDANRLLGLALQCEAQWLRQRNLGFGVSLYALAIKPVESQS